MHMLKGTGALPFSLLRRRERGPPVPHSAALYGWSRTVTGRNFFLMRWNATRPRGVDLTGGWSLERGGNAQPQPGQNEVSRRWTVEVAV